MLAKRAIAFEEEVKEIDAILKALVAETAPELERRHRRWHRRRIGTVGRRR